MVRLVGENVDDGIFPIREALNIADGQDLDLVEISPTANPPVCKVIDYKKFLFDRKKKLKETGLIEPPKWCPLPPQDIK